MQSVSLRKDPEKLRRKLLDYLRSPFSDNISATSTEELLGEFYGIQVPEKEIGHLRLQLYAILNQFLAEVTECPRRFRHQQDYLESLMTLASKLELRPDLYKLRDLFCAPELFDFWRDNSELKEDVKELLLDHTAVDSRESFTTYEWRRITSIKVSDETISLTEEK